MSSGASLKLEMDRTCGSVLKVQLHSTSVVALMVTRKSRICTFQSINAAAKGFSFSRWLMSTHFLRPQKRSASGQPSAVYISIHLRSLLCSSSPSQACLTRNQTAAAALQASSSC